MPDTKTSPRSTTTDFDIDREALAQALHSRLYPEEPWSVVVDEEREEWSTLADAAAVEVKRQMDEAWNAFATVIRRGNNPEPRPVSSSRWWRSGR